MAPALSRNSRRRWTDCGTVGVSGPEAAAPIVVLHGLGASLHTWDAWAERLPDYRVICFDLPGYARPELVTDALVTR